MIARTGRTTSPGASGPGPESRPSWDWGHLLRHRDPLGYRVACPRGGGAGPRGAGAGRLYIQYSSGGRMVELARRRLTSSLARASSVRRHPANLRPDDVGSIKLVLGQLSPASSGTRPDAGQRTEPSRQGCPGCSRDDHAVQEKRAGRAGPSRPGSLQQYRVTKVRGTAPRQRAPGNRRPGIPPGRCGPARRVELLSCDHNRTDSTPVITTFGPLFCRSNRQIRSPLLSNVQ
jgi:hypothetical protein